MDLAPLLAASPQIKIHLAAAIVAFALGSVIFLNRKGTRFHKTLGWTYVTAMTVVAASAIFIRREMGDPTPNIAGFTPIHLFVVMTAVSLPMALIAIRSGDIRGHRNAMTGLFIGAMLIAGGLTFLPGRIMHAMVFGG